MSDSTPAEAIPQPRQFLSAEEVAGVLRVSPNTIRRWTREKRISCFKAGKSAARYELAKVLGELEQAKK